MVTLDELVDFLRDNGVTLTELSRRDSFSVSKQWTSVFASSDQESELRGVKAINAWLEADEEDLLLLLLSERIAAFPISQNNRPCAAFRYAGPAIDLSLFHELEFAVFPTSYRWTVVHTHEDFAFGGPYFLRRLDRGPEQTRRN